MSFVRDIEPGICNRNLTKRKNVGNEKTTKIWKGMTKIHS
jgi:hypothetical protein